MGQTRVRYTLNSNLLIGCAVIMTMAGLMVLHYINLAGDGGVLFHLFISLCFAAVAWFCFRGAGLSAWTTREGIVLDEFYTQTTVPFRLVSGVTQRNGLSLLLSGGRYLRVPGFEGSIVGEMRGYPASYDRARRALERDLERARGRRQPDPEAQVSTEAHLQLWVLLTLTAILFVFAQVNLYLLGRTA
ncbi:hypothetical protein [Nocardiopsis valliformis]|uniref:hypothetical protein n=1 Tax=Nocardiopsis valliformis TaxID=239974 RepID=UPI00034D63F9|nr:hypothetical protein [Nocardiopsis valliformis]